jgi:Uma2 family endonuclease
MFRTMATRAPKDPPATYADLEALPPHVVGQIIDGELFVLPRPAIPHATVSSTLGEELGPPFRRGRGGPGGWILLDEPELHFGKNVLVPDLAGWRREHLPELPAAPYLTLAPDWLCEVVSPSSSSIDRVRKPRIYAREGVAWIWIIDPDGRSLEVLKLDGESYRIVDAFEGDEPVRAAPFDAIELELGLLWRA